MTFKIIKYDNYKDNLFLVQEIRDLIVPSYMTAGEHIIHDIEICNELYVLRDGFDRMLAFFMVGYHSIGKNFCCYLGLSACDQKFKKNGLVKSLYLKFAEDCTSKESEIGTRIICYWTTATPIVYFWFNKHFSGVQPDLNGLCTVKGVAILQLIASQKYSEAEFDIKTPYVLRQAAHEINYSDTERATIRQAAIDLKLTVFDEYNLNETKGDRFLMFGYTPE